MKYSRITNDEDNKCQPVFWQTPCCTHTLSPLLSIMWVLSHRMMVTMHWARQALGQVGPVRWVCVPDYVPDLQHWLIRVVVSRVCVSCTWQYFLLIYLNYCFGKIITCIAYIFYTT
jgi:hypothetical protein